MKIIGTIAISIMLIGLSAYSKAYAAPVGDNFFDSYTVDNGDWLRFGPAIITKCETIIISDEDDRFTLTRGDNAFDSAKNWLYNEFKAKLNSSMKKPSVQR